MHLVENTYELGVSQQKLNPEYTHAGGSNSPAPFVHSDIQREQITFLTCCARPGNSLKTQNSCDLRNFFPRNFAFTVSDNSLKGGNLGLEIDSKGFALDFDLGSVWFPSHHIKP